MSVASRSRRVKQNVLHILEHHPETRNDDKLLMLKYWELFDELSFDETFPTVFAARATNPESIRRARQSIQESGLYLPTTEEIRKRRRILQEEMRQYYAQN